MLGHTPPNNALQPTLERWRYNLTCLVARGAADHLNLCVVIA